jgi:hypothetical protein
MLVEMLLVQQILLLLEEVGAELLLLEQTHLPAMVVMEVLDQVHGQVMP